VQAEVPELEFIRYAIELRSLAHGTGSYSRQYLRHAPAPDHVVTRLRADEKES
jgi:elongation factor G